jgi:hypothetical protein
MAKTSYIKTLEDKNLHPYFITMDDYCFTVHQDLSKALDKSYTKKLGHFKNLDSALERVATHKTNASDYNSIKEYLVTYREIKESLKLNL